MQMTGAFAALCACWLVSASEPRVHELRAEGPVWDVTAEDFSGDGVSDVLAFCCDDLADTPRKWLSVFVSDGQGGYAATPTANQPLPDKAGAVFLAEIDGKPPKEVVAVHGGGARVKGLAGVVISHLIQADGGIHKRGAIFKGGGDTFQLLHLPGIPKGHRRVGRAV